MKKLVLISDTHRKHNLITEELLQLDPESILVHAGDISGRGYYSEIEDFLCWFNELPFKNKIMICGNHDFLFEDNPERIKEILEKYPTITYLEDSGTEVDGIKFWGSPVTPRFHDWAFNRDENIQEHWDKIPLDTNVLITHGPPANILDLTAGGKSTGCPRLLSKIKELKDLKIHVFGHIHEANGIEEIDGVTYINASSLDLFYLYKNSPVSINL